LGERVGREKALERFMTGVVWERLCATSAVSRYLKEEVSKSGGEGEGTEKLGANL